ncbi:MAG: chromosome segregation protein SMC [Candidatus Altiarchaeota archaeon]|nr:chromosome segregation protein SMC [Candidatus Altiarchaeota archaeon]
MKSGSRLEKLSMRGFKSFSKPTTLLFSPGITSIVGPNGSGKSNVLDALSFVMGSLSFSALRSKSAENLIYFGKTKQSNDAEVGLRIRIDSEFSDDGILSLNRKLSRNGTSVYRINGKRSTRLATIDILASMHIFPDSHNIVRQGDITRFVNMSARQRRELIEVVAGIELYERKKTKAMTDLDGVEIKIEKVEAVHGERVRIFTQLKEEKEKVNQFNNMKELEGRAKYSILLNDIENLRNKLNEFNKNKSNKEEKINVVEESMKQKTDELMVVSSNLEKRGMREKVGEMTRLERLKMEFEKKEEEKHRETTGIESSSKRIESIKSQVAGLKRRQKDTYEDISTKRNRLKDIKKETQEYKKLRDELTAKVSKAKQDFEQRKHKYERLKEKKERWTLKSKELLLEKQSNERLTHELIRKLKNEETRKLSLESEKQKILDGKKILEKRISSINLQLKETESKLKLAREGEKEILYSSTLPEGVRELQKKGYKVLGEVVGDPSEIMPFALSIVASDAEIKTMKVEKGWVYVVSDKVDIEKLKELSKMGRAIGKITGHEFVSANQRNAELETLQKTIESLEKRRDSLREERSTIDGKLTQTFDMEKMKNTIDSIKIIKRDISERKTRLVEINSEMKELSGEVLKMGDLKEPTIGEARRLEEVTSKIYSLESELMRTSSEIKAEEDTLKNLIEPDILNYEKLGKSISDEIKNSKATIADTDKRKIEIGVEIREVELRIAKIEGLLSKEITVKSEIEEFLKASQNTVYQLKSDIAVLNEKIKGITGRIQSLEESKPQGIQRIENPRDVLKQVVNQLEQLGTLNFKAIEEFKEVSGLVEDISDRLKKLRDEKNAILSMMNEIESQKFQMFMETFEKINASFSKIFSQVIEGSSRLEIDGDDPFESGVHIKTRVQHRDLPTESLSGGQKTLAALALIFAIQEVKPSPLYVFDEIDAALDKPNSEKLAKMFKKMSETTQIISITHNDTMVKESDQIVGVYINKGASRLVSLPKDKVMKEAESWISKN